VYSSSVTDARLWPKKSWTYFTSAPLMKCRLPCPSQSLHWLPATRRPARITRTVSDGLATGGLVLRGQPMTQDSRAVLVIEDDTDLRAWVVLVLRRRGYPVLEAADGLRAIRVIEQHEPAADNIGLILLDVMLPFLSGVELVRGLSDHLNGIPVVAISGSLKELDETSAAGATDVLAKPFSAKAVLDMVARHWPPQRGEAPRILPHPAL
jgi:CheY-like chemotaxis protein